VLADDNEIANEKKPESSSRQHPRETHGELSALSLNLRAEEVCVES
jgi:hypothetical protein